MENLGQIFVNGQIVDLDNTTVKDLESILEEVQKQKDQLKDKLDDILEEIYN